MTFFPRAARSIAAVAASPTESSANSTGRPISSDSLAATGRSEYSGFGVPFGRKAVSGERSEPIA